LSIKSRIFLSKKEKKELFGKIKEFKVPEEFLSKSIQIERVVLEDYVFYMKNGKVIFFEVEDTIFPTINYLRDYNIEIPAVIVDIGAIKFIVNGADVMAPGVVFFDPKIKVGMIVCIKEEKSNAILAIGKALINAEKFKETKKGKVVSIYHHLNDKIWKFKT